jgi:hypothetical protein
MSGRVALAVAVALALAPAMAAADKAQRRGGSGGSSSGAGGRQPSSSKTGSTSTKVGSSSGMTKTGRAASRPPATAAQRRQPRPGTGTGAFDLHGGYGYGPYRPYRPYGYGYGYGYRGYSYSPFYSPAYRYGYTWYAPYSWGSFGPAPTYKAPEDQADYGSVRVLVRPEKARVYVDGYYAGTVDDYDGIFQRLRVEPGPHRVTLRLEGYRTQHFDVYVPFGDTLRLRHEMVKGAGEATSQEYSGRPAGYSRMEEDEELPEQPERE